VHGWSAEVGVEVNLGEGEETDGHNEPGSSAFLADEVGKSVH